ncbi:MAG: PilZ domain-containing protein, partial [Candidatus Baltobacteraceae bacterium]
EIDISPFGPRIVKKPHPGRPFEEIQVHAKVVRRFADSRGRVVVGIQFVHIDSFDREQIARYIHAAQIYKLRFSS